MTFIELNLKPEEDIEENDSWQNQLPSSSTDSEVISIRVDCITAIEKECENSCVVYTNDQYFNVWDSYDKITSLLRIAGAKIL